MLSSPCFESPQSSPGPLQYLSRRGRHPLLVRHREQPAWASWRCGTQRSVACAPTSACTWLGAAVASSAAWCACRVGPRRPGTSSLESGAAVASALTPIPTGICCCLCRSSYRGLHRLGGGSCCRHHNRRLSGPAELLTGLARSRTHATSILPWNMSNTNAPPATAGALWSPPSALVSGARDSPVSAACVAGGVCIASQCARSWITQPGWRCTVMQVACKLCA